MDRRHVLKGIGVITLYGSFPAVLSEFLSSCSTKQETPRAGFFTDAEFKLVESLIDTLLPATTTQGAADTQVPYFVDLVVRDCLKLEDQEKIKKGLKQFGEQSATPFPSIPPAEQLVAIKKLDEAAFRDDPDKAWFRIIKKFTLIGYFTSREGMTAALRYVKVPGDYKACVPYKNGEKALAKTFLMYW